MISGDTIAAFSSAVVPSARIILRLSGSQAIALSSRTVDGPLPGAWRAARMQIEFDGLRFPAWIYVFHGPRSYTGEDIVEFHLPGNPLLARMLLRHFLQAGARAAEAGEFTARAYFNGKMDLTTAEGVAATIHASNQDQLLAARQLLAGELARRIDPIIEQITQTLALVEAGIDFSDEDVSFLSMDECRQRVGAVDAALEQLLRESSRFETLTTEPTFVLVGRPNAGKSTLLNVLAGQDRAIVSPVAGTTRDALSAQVMLRRGMIRLVDIAGLEDPAFQFPVNGDFAQAQIDQSMRAHALREVESADRVILLRDLKELEADPDLPRIPDLTILTKADLHPEAKQPPSAALCISAKTGLGLDKLRTAMDQLAFGARSFGAAFALNARHLCAIEEARDALARAKDEVVAKPELLAMELREALDSLGQISGQITPDDVLGRVFATFCIGK